MAQSPSSIRFVSFLRYAPQGKSEVSLRTIEICRAIKKDGLVEVPNAAGDGRELVRAIDRSAVRIAALLQQFPVLQNVLGGDVTLIPVPRSAPIKPGSLWPAERICRALVARGLASEVLPCLERVTAVPKSSVAGKGARPSPDDHRRSLRVNAPPTLIPPKRLVIVDDVVTRGATFLGALPHVEEVFPGIPIICFGLVRSESNKEVEGPVDPVEGVISIRGGQPHREP